MSETKFTPGPWGPREGRIDTGVIVGGPMRAFRNGSTQCQIALACLSESVDENTRRANAALIAAAPDLYEALNEIFRRYENKDDMNDMEATAWADRARAALLRAQATQQEEGK